MFVVKYYQPFKKNLEESLMNTPISYSPETYKKNDQTAFPFLLPGVTPGRGGGKPAEPFESPIFLVC